MTLVRKDSIIGRWARLVAEVVNSEADIRNLADWARRLNIGEGTLRQICHSAGVKGKLSLDLARVLRAVVSLQGGPWRPEAVLDCRDPRTLDSLLDRIGCTHLTLPLTLDEFLCRQTALPQDGFHLLALRQALCDKSIEFSSDFCLDPLPDH